MTLPAEIEVQVEQRHIDSGERFTGDRCPIALALSEKVTGRVHVGYADVTIYGAVGHPLTIYCLTPPKMRKFAKAFDTGKPVKPSTFVIQTQS